MFVRRSRSALGCMRKALGVRPVLPRHFSAFGPLRQTFSEDQPPEDEEFEFEEDPSPRLPLSIQSVWYQPFKREPIYGIPVCNLQVRSYSVRNLEFMCDFALRAAYYCKLPASGPVPLPRRIERWTVPRGHFVHKKSQENFERVTYKRLIQIKDGHPETVELWLAFIKKHQFYGTGMKANVWSFEELGVGKRMKVSLNSLRDLPTRPPWAGGPKTLEATKKAAAEILNSPEYRVLADQVTDEETQKAMPEGADKVASNQQVDLAEGNPEGEAIPDQQIGPAEGGPEAVDVAGTGQAVPDQVDPAERYLKGEAMGAEEAGGVVPDQRVDSAEEKGEAIASSREPETPETVKKAVEIPNSPEYKVLADQVIDEETQRARQEAADEVASNQQIDPAEGNPEGKAVNAGGAGGVAPDQQVGPAGGNPEGKAVDAEGAGEAAPLDQQADPAEGNPEGKAVDAKGAGAAVPYQRVGPAGRKDEGKAIASSREPKTLETTKKASEILNTPESKVLADRVIDEETQRTGEEGAGEAAPDQVGPAEGDPGNKAVDATRAGEVVPDQRAGPAKGNPEGKAAGAKGSGELAPNHQVDAEGAALDQRIDPAEGKAEGETIDAVAKVNAGDQKTRKVDK